MTQNVPTTGAFPLDDDIPVRTPSQPADADASTTTEVAKDQAAGVGQSAADAGQHVASVAKGEAQNVAGEAVHQTKNLLGQTRDELTEQAGQQQQRVAEGLRSLSRELGTMADGSQEAGLATDLARQAAARTGDLAGWLEQRDPQGVLEEMKTFARRRPGTFLAIALGAGLAAGRLTRGLKDDSSSSTPGSASGSASGSTRGTMPGGVPSATPSRPVPPPDIDESLYGRAQPTAPEVPVESAGYPAPAAAPGSGPYGEQGYTR